MYTKVWVGGWVGGDVQHYHTYTAKLFSLSTLTCCMDDDWGHRAPLGSRMRAANSAIKVLRADMTRPLPAPPSPSPSTSRSPQGGKGQETTKTLKKLDEAWQVRGRKGNTICSRKG